MSRSSVAYAEVQAAASAVHWLVDVEIGGYVYRAADEDVDVVDANGTTWRYRAGIGADFAVQLRSSADTSVKVQLSADVQGTPGGWASVLPAPPHGSPVVVRRWLEGQTLDEARVVMAGEVYDATYDDPDAPLDLSVRWLDQTPNAVPPAQAQVGPLTWPTDPTYAPDEARIGAAYPLIIGAPGLAPDVAWGTAFVRAYSSPGYLAQHSDGAAVYSGSRMVIAWSPDGSEGIDATTVSVIVAHDDSTSSNGRGFAVQSLTVNTEQDLLGRWVATVGPGGYTGVNTTVPFKPGKEYWIRWNDGGGVLDETRSGPMRRAGEVIAYLLRLSGLKVNAGRMAAARARLDRYLLDFALVESQEDIRSFIEREIGRFIPLVRRTSADGMWYEALNYYPRPEDAVLHLVAQSPDLEAFHYREEAETGYAPIAYVARVPGITYTDEPVANTVTLRFAFSRGTQHTAEVVVTGRDPDADASEIGSAICAASMARYKERTGEPIECKIVHDRATAEIVALEYAGRLAQPRRRLSFVGDVADLETLEPGDVVRVTDTQRNVTNVLALVDSIDYTLTTLTVSVECLDHLALIGSV